MEVHSCFKLNDISFNKQSLIDKAKQLQENGLDYEKDNAKFLQLWLNNEDTLEVTTSGSTGTPKIIKLSKKAMIASANATGTYFNLKEKTKALLCLPATYIAGKMMFVRALVLGWELDCIEPKSKLSIPQKAYDFSAMVPMQVEANLHRLNAIKVLIVGGAKVASSLVASIQLLNTKVYETYGMTETITHIAVKPLNFNNSIYAHFKILPYIKIAKDNRGCLVIEAPKLSDDKIITNDVVALHSKSTFEWLGRFDNVINSGGIKLFPEQIEQKLQHKIKERFFIASIVDIVLGERVILVVETNQLKETKELYEELKPFEKPKDIYCVPKFIETPSGKVKRYETLTLIT